MLTYVVNSWNLIKLSRYNKSYLIATYLHLGTPYLMIWIMSLIFDNLFNIDISCNVLSELGN